MKKIFVILSLFLSLEANVKILHLTFHKGCAEEIKAVGKHFGFEIHTWLIPDLPPKFLDGMSSGNVLYNIGHKRAAAIWEIHKELFLQFDGIITSDTTPLARIFLQNGFSKPLIIWVCNRFDYYDYASLDCDFPDAEFYQLLDGARHRKNVAVIAYTPFELAYALDKGIDLGDLTITPSGLCQSELRKELPISSIDRDLRKEETFFLPSYHNETIFLDFANFCKELKIPVFCGRYNGPTDLKDFKGIIHLPYAWSNLALFENLAFGIPYFIPSSKFLLELLNEGPYWHQDCRLLESQIHLSEWYQPEKKEVFTYFDSWEDLVGKLQSCNYEEKRETIKKFAKNHQEKTLDQWEKVFKGLFSM